MNAIAGIVDLDRLGVDAVQTTCIKLGRSRTVEGDRETQLLQFPKN